MLIKFSEGTIKILKNAKEEMFILHHPFIGSEHVLLSILSENNDISIKLKKYHITYDCFKEELIKKVGIGTSNNNYLIYTPLLKRVIENTILDAKEAGINEIDINMLFLSILDEGEGVANRILINMGLNIDKIYEELNHNHNIKNNKKLLISDYSTDLTKLNKEIDPLIGRDGEIDEIINILLRKNKNNPLLIGEAGVGKTHIVEELAKRIVIGNVPKELCNKKILSLSMASCVAGTKYRGEFEEKLTKMVKELENNDEIIVFIDEIHTLVGAGGAEGAIDASNILKPYLARNSIKIIGATTIKEYKETISKDKALNRRFQTVLINENSIDETVNILLKVKKAYEDFHHVIIKDEIIKEIVYLADRYISNRNNPDKSIDILDMVCTHVSLKSDKKNKELLLLKEKLLNLKKNKDNLIIKHQFREASKLKKEEMELVDKINLLELSLNREKKRIVKINDVKKIIEAKTKIPIYDINNKSNKLIKLEDYLKKKIVGQDIVIEKISNTTKKIMLGLKSDLPYSFLLVGRSGVGKTLLVKEYSKYLNIPLIRLDMSEYKDSSSITKIIGSSPGYIGYNDVDTVLEKIKTNPFCIILLDEIEKACNEVINLFLQILDEGIVTDSHGVKVNLRNTIIMMTSNIGSEQENIGFMKDRSNEKIHNVLSTPFVNRINNIIYFNCLTENDLFKILQNRIKELRKKYAKYHIKLRIDGKDIQDIICGCNYEIYGTRKALKILDDKVDNIVINDLFNKKKKIISVKC